jgi:hypothetical protein
MGHRNMQPNKSKIKKYPVGTWFLPLFLLIIACSSEADTQIGAAAADGTIEATEFAAITETLQEGGRKKDKYGDTKCRVVLLVQLAKTAHLTSLHQPIAPPQYPRLKNLFTKFI